MESPVFLLAKDPENDCRDLIFQRDGNLRLKVICLEDQEWHLNPEEMQLYAKKNNGEQLVFETIDYNHQEPGLIIEAIKWYANYIGNPEMEIEAELDE
jgi:hypothetical protein